MYKSVWLPKKFKCVRRNSWIPWLCLFIYSSLGSSKQSTIAVYLDFLKAFDTVNHDILMSKFLHNGVIGKVDGLKEVWAVRIPTKTKYSSKGRWRHMAWKSLTNIGRFVDKFSPIRFKYIKNEIYKTIFFRTRNFTLTCTELWSVIIFVENVLGCCRRYWRSASYMPVIGSSNTCGPKYF